MTLALITFVVTFLSGAVQIVTGFGFAVVMMALLPMLLPYDLVRYMALLGGSSIGVWLSFRFRKKIAWRTVLIPTLFSLLGTLIGILTDSKVSGGIYTRMLGVLLCLMAIWMQFFARKVRIPANFLTGAVAGAATGTLNALFAMGGPPLVLYYTSVLEDKESYAGTLNLVVTVSALLSVASHAAIAGPPVELLPLVLPWVLGLLCAAVVGKKIFSRINADQMRQVIYVFMFLVGLYFIITG